MKQTTALGQDVHMSELLKVFEQLSKHPDFRPDPTNSLMGDFWLKLYSMNAVNYLVKPAAINSSLTISGVTVLCKLPRFVLPASIGVISGSGFKGLEPQKYQRLGAGGSAKYGELVLSP